MFKEHTDDLNDGNDVADAASTQSAYDEPTLFLSPASKELCHRAGRNWYAVSAISGKRAVFSGQRRVSIAGISEKLTFPIYCTPRFERAVDAQSFFALQRSVQPHEFHVRGDISSAGREMLSRHGIIRRTKNRAPIDKRNPKSDYDPACLREIPRRGNMIDIDGSLTAHLLAAGIDFWTDPEDAIRHVVENYLPPAVVNSPLQVQITYSSGKAGAHDLRLHIFCWTDEPITGGAFKRWLLDYARSIGIVDLFDGAPYNAAQPHFSNGECLDEQRRPIKDPIPQRWFLLNRHLQHAVLPEEAFAKAAYKTKGAAVHKPNLAPAAPVAPPVGSAAVVDALLDSDMTSDQWFATLGPGSFNEPLLKGTYALAREKPSLEGQALLFRQEVERIRAIVREAGKGHEKTSELNRHIGDVERMLATAFARLREWREWQVTPAAEVAVVASSAAPEVSLADAEGTLSNFLTEFAKSARAKQVAGKGAQYTLSPKLRFGDDESEKRSSYRAERNEWFASDEYATATADEDEYKRLISLPSFYVAAHETGVAKTTKAIESILNFCDVQNNRVLFYSPNHDIANQVAQTVQALDPTASVMHVGNISFVTDDPDFGLCDLDDEQQREQWGTIADNGGSKAETICRVCPKRTDGCRYWEQAEDLKKPGIKLLMHSHIKLPPKGLWLRDDGSDREDFAPVACAVFDEDFSNALFSKSTLSLPLFAEAGWTSNENIMHALIKSVADDKIMRTTFPANRGPIVNVQRSTSSGADVVATRVSDFAREADEAADAVQRSLGRSVSEVGDDGQVKWPYEALAKRAMRQTFRELAQLIADQLEHGRDAELLGFTARTTEDRLVLELNYRKPMPDRFGGQFGIPTLVLDATITEERAEWVTMQRDRWFAVDEFGDGIEGSSAPLPAKAPVTAVGSGQKSGFAFCRERVRKPHCHVISVLGAPTSRNKLGLDALKPKRKGGKLPGRMRSDANVEVLARCARLISESATGQVGLFTHMAHREYKEAHGMLGENVLASHHGRGTGSNAWADCERFMVLGKTELAPHDVLPDAKAFFALHWDKSPIRETMDHDAKQLVRIKDCQNVQVRVRRFADPRTEARRSQLSNAALEQIVGRVRGVRREAHNPVVVFVLTDEFLDLEYDAIVDWSQLQNVGALDIAEAAGIVPAGKQQAATFAKLFPGVFDAAASAEMVKKTLQREKMERVENGTSPFSSSSIIGACPDIDADAGAPSHNGSNGASMPAVRARLNSIITEYAPFDLSTVETLAGAMPSSLASRQLAPHTVKLDRGNRNISKHELLVAPDEASREAALARCANAYGRPAKSITQTAAYAEPIGPARPAQPAAPVFAPAPQAAAQQQYGSAARDDDDRYEPTGMTEAEIEAARDAEYACYVPLGDGRWQWMPSLDERLDALEAAHLADLAAFERERENAQERTYEERQRQLRAVWLPPDEVLT